MGLAALTQEEDGLVFGITLVPRFDVVRGTSDTAIRDA